MTSPRNLIRFEQGLHWQRVPILYNGPTLSSAQYGIHYADNQQCFALLFSLHHWYSSCVFVSFLGSVKVALYLCQYQAQVFVQHFTVSFIVAETHPPSSSSSSLTASPLTWPFPTTYYLNKSFAVAEMGDRLATTNMGRKVGAAVPLSMGEAGFPFNTMSPGSRPTSLPSGILIHPTVWPQYTTVTDRQTDRQTDNGPIA